MDENSLISTKEEPPVLEREAPFLEGPLAQSDLGVTHAELPQLTLSVPVAPEASPRPALESEELLVKTPGKVGMGIQCISRFNWKQLRFLLCFVVIFYYIQLPILFEEIPKIVPNLIKLLTTNEYVEHCGRNVFSCPFMIIGQLQCEPTSKVAVGRSVAH